MVRRAIVPLDRSPFAERALGYATTIAETFAARLVLARAFEGPERVRYLVMARAQTVQAGVVTAARPNSPLARRVGCQT